jgi:hypothetical protein
MTILDRFDAVGPKTVNFHDFELNAWRMFAFRANASKKQQNEQIEGNNAGFRD